jgi:hypothetical protein
MSDDPRVQESPDAHVRARIERTASGKLVQMLTADEHATAAVIDATTALLVTSFAVFEQRAQEKLTP